jgi:glycine/D-amino acid oxidase-like deaminating enzyme
MVIWQGKSRIHWDPETMAMLREEVMPPVTATADDAVDSHHDVWFLKGLLDVQPGGQHFRPCGGTNLLMLWTHFNKHLPLPQPLSFPPPVHPLYAEATLRGVGHAVPGLLEPAVMAAMSRSAMEVDGGYYTVTPDGRPIVGPRYLRDRTSPASSSPCIHVDETSSSAPVDGYIVCAGFGGYGVMASYAAGHLTASHVRSFFAEGDEEPDWSQSTPGGTKVVGENLRANFSCGSPGGREKREVLRCLRDSLEYPRRASTASPTPAVDLLDESV